MVKEELVSSEEEKRQASLGREAEKREGRELPRRDEPEDFQTLYEESLKTLEDFRMSSAQLDSVSRIQQP